MKGLRSIWLAGIAVATPAAAMASETGAPDRGPAQQAPATEAEDQIDTIVVTARRREESAQTVPVSVTALGTQALEEKQVRNLGDLTNVAPGIRFVSQGGSGNMNVILRGIGKAPAGDAPNSVITYFGDIPLFFWGSAIPTYDLASVQVLKGPQGTLFGRNSIGGAVIVSPARPTFELEGYVRGSFGNYNYRDIEAAVNLPILADKVALRLAGKLTRRDGYVKNISFRDADLSDQHQDSLRASLLIEPTDNFRNITVFDWFRARENNEGTILYQLYASGGQARNPALAASFDCHTVTAANPVPCVGFQPNRDIDDAFAQQKAIGNRAVASSAPLFLNRDFWGIQNRTELKLGDVELRNIFGFRSTKIDLRNQAQSAGFGVENVVPPPPAGTPVSLLDGYNARSIGQLSEELQAVGAALNDRVDYIFGAFYIKEYPTGVIYGKNNIGGYGSSFALSYNESASKALYGQLGIRIVDGLKLNAGYRHTWDTQNVCITTTPAAAGFPTLKNSDCRRAGVGTVVKYKKDAPTYTLGVDWQVNDNVFAYVTHRRSFRVGGVNAPIYNTPGTAILVPYQTYDPEKLIDYEIGVKTDWNVGAWQIRFNIDAYRTDYSNVNQILNVASLIPPNDPAFPTSSGSIIINTGSQRFTGVEAEFTIKPTSTLSLSGNAAYIHVKANTPPTPFPTLPPPAAVPLAPTWATSASVRWELPFRPMDGKLIFNADYFYQTEFKAGNATFPAYDVTNARLEWDGIGGSGASAALFVRNVFDQENIVAAGATSAGLGFASAQYSEPRMYGLELAYRF